MFYALSVLSVKRLNVKVFSVSELTVVMECTIVLSVIILTIIMLSVIILTIVMLSVIILTIVMLNVIAECRGAITKLHLNFPDEGDPRFDQPRVAAKIPEHPAAHSHRHRRHLLRGPGVNLIKLFPFVTDNEA